MSSRTEILISVTVRPYTIHDLQVSGFPPFIVELFVVTISRDRRGSLPRSITSPLPNSRHPIDFGDIRSVPAHEREQCAYAIVCRTR